MQGLCTYPTPPPPPYTNRAYLRALLEAEKVQCFRSGTRSLVSELLTIHKSTCGWGCWTWKNQLKTFFVHPPWPVFFWLDLYFGYDFCLNLAKKHCSKPKYRVKQNFLITLWGWRWCCTLKSIKNYFCLLHHWFVLLWLRSLLNLCFVLEINKESLF